MAAPPHSHPLPGAAQARRRRPSAWVLAALGLAVASALFLAFLQLMHEAVERGVQQRGRLVAQEGVEWRCQGLRVRALREECQGGVAAANLLEEAPSASGRIR